MMKRALRLLLVEDMEDHALLLLRQLQGEFDVSYERVETPAELEVALRHGPWDVVFADYNLPSFTGLDALRIMQEKGMDLPFILVSGVIGEEQAVEALKSGAHDFILKGQYVRLLPALKRALKDAALRHERRQTAEELSRHREHLEDLVQQRTEELAAANEELQAQSEELQAQSEELSSSLEELQRADQEKERLLAELAAANQELEAFNYTAAHDLRTPLTHISGYCDLVRMLNADRLDEESKGFLEEIINGTRKMANLIETLLRFSRLSHAELRREEVDLDIMAGEIIGRLRMMAPERAVAVTIAPGLQAHGDRQLLWLALENLLGNAWKYTARQEETRIEVGMKTTAGETVFFVRDNGEGFDMVDAEKLFTPFSRLPGVEEFKGHGIGLATVRRIIQRHGGRVYAEGAPGEGATFYFTLPGN
jgi:signal transduction histidine kinase